jgi:hypothetical protein
VWFLGSRLQSLTVGVLLQWPSLPGVTERSACNEVPYCTIVWLANASQPCVASRLFRQKLRSCRALMCFRTVSIILFHLHRLLSHASVCFACCGAEPSVGPLSLVSALTRWSLRVCSSVWFACFVAGSAFSLFIFLSHSTPQSSCSTCHSFRQRSGLLDLCHCAQRYRSINCSRCVVQCALCSALTVRHLLKPRPLLRMFIIPGESASSLAKVSSPRRSCVLEGSCSMGEAGERDASSDEVARQPLTHYQRRPLCALLPITLLEE